MNAGFAPVERCWVCDGGSLVHVCDARFELSAFAQQDPPLAAYSGEPIDIRRCAACGFAQPSAVPSLERYFDRMYDQQWADYWVEAEHRATSSAWLRDALACLNARERAVVCEHLYTEDTRSLTDLGRALGVSRQRAGQIFAHACDKLRAQLVSVA